MTDTTLGPTGGHGGQEFSNYTVPAGASVREVHIFAGLYVDAVQIAYVDANDALVILPKIGGRGFPSATHHVVTLEPGEVIVGISGRSGNYVDSIRIQTSRRLSDSFGGLSGEHEYRFDAPENGEIVGLFGRADWFIDALGVVVRERAAETLATLAAAASIVDAPVAAPVETPVVPAAKPAKAKAPAKTPPAAVPAETPVAPAVKPAKTKAPAKTPPAAAPAETPAAPTAKPAKAKAPAKTSDTPVESAPTRSAPVVELAPRTPAVDELLKVEGIGPKIEAVLIENGIPDLQTLAATPVERLREILHAAGARYRIADPTTWPQQAALGARGDWAGMEALKVTLRAGRKQE